MQQWITAVLDAPEFGLLVIPAALLLGLIASVGSCCNYGIMAAVAGFAGSRETLPRRDVWQATVALVVGSVIAFAVLGMLIGHLGAAMNAGIGRYGTVLAALVVILFGLIALRLFPFRLPSLGAVRVRRPTGTFGPVILGLAVGSASISCSLLCSGPLLPIALGLAVLRGEGYWGVLITSSFALGYSVPLAAMMLGVGFGRLTFVAGRAVPVVRVIGGVLMIGAGFWMLLSL